MSFTQTNAIEVKQIKGKGRGVFARRLIHDGEVIERVPVLVLPVGETRTASGPTPDVRLLLRVGSGDGGGGSGLRLALQPLVPAQRSLRRRERTDQGIQGNPGYRTGRGDRGQLQRRAGGRDAGLVQDDGERAITEGARMPRRTARQRRSRPTPENHMGISCERRRTCQRKARRRA